MCLRELNTLNMQYSLDKKIYNPPYDFTFMCLIKDMHIKQLLLEKIRTRTN